MGMKQTVKMAKAEKEFKAWLKMGVRPNIGEIARKHKLSVAAFYQARWYKELKLQGEI